MVASVRKGASMREVARRFGVSLSVVQRWVERAAGRRLDRVDWEGHSRRPRKTTRTLPVIEDLVLEVRRELREQSVLGEYGDSAIGELLRTQHDVELSVSTIARILRRRGAVEKSSRWRRPAPPKGWYLPDVRDHSAEIDSWDFIEGLVIRGGIQVAVLTATSLHGGIPGAFVQPARSARGSVAGLVTHWRRHGLPRYAQFDNDTVFQGPHQKPDVVGSVSRACLSLGVTPVFAPPREHGPQNAIESFNALWQRKLWHRHEWSSREHLQGGSDLYVRALIARRSKRIAAAPAREVFPPGDELDLDADLRGRIVYLRRADDDSFVELLGRRFELPRDWSHRLVRAEVDLDADEIRFHGLSRRSPDEQFHLWTVSHHVKRSRRKGRP